MLTELTVFMSASGGFTRRDPARELAGFFVDPLLPFATLGPIDPSQTSPFGAACSHDSSVGDRTI